MSKAQLWQRGFLAVFLLLAGVTALLWAAGYYGHFPVSGTVLLTLWRTAIAAFLGYAILRRSLTAWILVGMLIGAEIGYDLRFLGKEARERAVADVQVLSQIFLRLIKTIVAPLIFGTLVVGIAGHSNLKQVGRMGVKTLVYFEVITTLALFIGLAAINLSKAGIGVKVPANVAAPPPQIQKPTASDPILHAFPENIAKSVAENQVLQVVVFSIIFGIALAQVQEK